MGRARAGGRIDRPQNRPRARDPPAWCVASLIQGARAARVQEVRASIEARERVCVMWIERLSFALSRNGTATPRQIMSAHSSAVSAMLNKHCGAISAQGRAAIRRVSASVDASPSASVAP